MTQTLPNFHVIIPAAGIGLRSGLNKPKQYFDINGKSLLRITAEKFIAHPNCASVNVILAPNDANKDQIDNWHPKITAKPCGGNTRKETINNALNQLDEIKDKEIILVHDAARSYITAHDIDQILTAITNGAQAATLYKPVNDTLLDQQNQPLPREDLKAIQTPQAFTFAELKKAHTIAARDNLPATDDAGLVKTALGLDITYIKARDYNEKITTPQDIIMAQTLLAPRYETRTGLGYDVHAFESQSSPRKLMLCGIEVEHERALKGHSDADVGLHTITDALLGSISAGDIGRHFPPSDDAYKDMDSAIFLEKARDLIKAQNGIIANIDLTLICEAPKITPHAPAMITRVARILQIEESRVSIKATTSEKLGFTGRKEGIAAQAVATVKLPETL